MKVERKDLFDFKVTLEQSEFNTIKDRADIGKISMELVMGLLFEEAIEAIEIT